MTPTPNEHEFLLKEISGSVEGLRIPNKSDLSKASFSDARQRLNRFISLLDSSEKLLGTYDGGSSISGLYLYENYLYQVFYEWDENKRAHSHRVKITNARFQKQLLEAIVEDLRTWIGEEQIGAESTGKKPGGESTIQKTDPVHLESTNPSAEDLEELWDLMENQLRDYETILLKLDRYIATNNL